VEAGFPITPRSIKMMARPSVQSEAIALSSAACSTMRCKRTCVLFLDSTIAGRLGIVGSR
jgi:hypothetical protein